MLRTIPVNCVWRSQQKLLEVFLFTEQGLKKDGTTAGPSGRCYLFLVMIVSTFSMQIVNQRINMQLYYHIHRCDKCCLGKKRLSAAALGCCGAEGLETKTRAEGSMVHTKLRSKALPTLGTRPGWSGEWVCSISSQRSLLYIGRRPCLLTTSVLPSFPNITPKAGLVAGLRSVIAGRNVTRPLSSLSPASLCFLFASEEDILGTGSQQKGWLWWNRSLDKRAKVKYQ